MSQEEVNNVIMDLVNKKLDTQLQKLEEYLQLQFIKRSGCGIGLTRLLKSMEIL